MHSPPKAAALIDTHAHLDVAAFAPDRDAVLGRASSAGVVAQVIPAITRGHWFDSIGGLHDLVGGRMAF
jgi:Tat protein secretion system quality control protein TatD with DNase activity